MHLGYVQDAVTSWTLLWLPGNLTEITRLQEVTLPGQIVLQIIPSTAIKKNVFTLINH